MSLSKAAVAAALAGAALAGACGAAPSGSSSRPHQAPSPSARSAPPKPAICGALRATRTGAVQDGDVTELSGLALSPDQRGVLWAHNDSGDRARVFALRPDGTALAQLDVPGAEAVDWEDIAIGPAAPGARERALYVADIGDNAEQRATVEIYRVPEPRLPAGATTAPATRLRLRYADGPHDAEALLVEPRTGELAIVTKSFDGESRIYTMLPTVAARAAAGETITLHARARLHLGFGGAVTAGDVSADGRVVALRTYDRLLAWRRAKGETLGATLRRRPCTGRVSLGAEGQGEALALTRDGRAFFTAPEGAHAAIRRYAPRR